MTLSQIERRLRFLTAYAVGVSALLITATLTAFDRDSSFARTVEADTLRARVVVAEHVEVLDRGVTRVRLGGQLPDAVIDGRRLDRGDDIAGVILYDAEGRERSGYGTFDESGNVLLTLDAADRQTAFFVADPEGTTALRMWSGDDAIDLRVDSEGARISLVDSNRVVFQQPELLPANASEMCQTLQTLAEEHGTDPLLTVCRGRMTEAWCSACLAKPQD